MLYMTDAMCSNNSHLEQHLAVKNDFLVLWSVTRKSLVFLPK
jgi:hypothetical protein